jgi:peptidoglycan/xylan/chitin deacetylase (PgdA/CDA1 family)
MSTRRSIVLGWVRARLFVISGAIALAVAVPEAGASKAPPEPLQIANSTLTQSGQQISWSVLLTQPFSPGGLAGDHRSLCLLVERTKDGSVTAEVCVAGPRSRKGSRALKSPFRVSVASVTSTGVGRAHLISAGVSRAGSRQLTATFTPASIGIGYRPTRWQTSSTLKAAGCAPTTTGSAVCQTLFPRRPALADLHSPQVAGCVASGAPFVNSGPSNEGKVVALTFDDGPWVQTAQFLKVLEHYHVVATFFEIGENIATYGEGGAIERRMLADGDMIGDHTWSHPDVAGGGAFARDQIVRAAAAIRSATHGFTPCLFRAPYGAVSPALFAVTKSLGFKTIQWSVDPTDWARPGTAAIEERVLSHVHPGSIVLQHDGGGDRSETLAALPDEIQTLKRRGYRFETITQLFGMKLLYR